MFLQLCLSKHRTFFRQIGIPEKTAPKLSPFQVLTEVPRHGGNGPAWSSHQLATLCYAMLRWWKLIPDEFWFDPDVCVLLLALAGHVEDATKRRTFLRFDSTLEYSLKHCQSFRAKSQATTYIHISHIACRSMLFISFLWRPTDYKIFLDRRHAVK